MCTLPEVYYVSYRIPYPVYESNNITNHYNGCYLFLLVWQREKKMWRDTVYDTAHTVVE